MSSLRLTTLTLPTAVLGPDNPLPPLASGADLNAGVEIGHGVDDEMRANLSYGHVPSIAPYLLQDDYGRVRVPTEHPVAILENHHLRATFLTGLGGRLWSLWDKGAGRELLYSNTVIQPGNLALRDAWFAGGVEWNIGTIGHTPLTASPLHVARVELPDGTPVLRMWELERLREVVYQLDAWLPDDAARLVVSVRITNPHDHDVPMYWWSNIAVPQSDDVRVVVPADAAWSFTYGSSVDRVPMPVTDGVDRSYPTRSRTAADYFFDLEAAPLPWVAALDATGSGLVQSSTRELPGRKLFLWGTGPGGRHWQEWLSPAGGSYLEIQAGLARTQLEHLRMPAKAQWSWVEAFGLLEVDPLLVHGTWSAARYAVATAVEAATPREWMDRLLSTATRLGDVVPAEILQQGSGWGALERLRRERAGDHSLSLPGTPFPGATLVNPSDEQAPWVRLLEDGVLPTADVGVPPASYQTAPGWKDLLQGSTSWLGLLHLGVAEWQGGDRASAQSFWEASLLAAPSAWAWRNLALARRARGDDDGALAAYGEASELAPDLLPLVVERLETLLALGRLTTVVELVESLPREQHASPRVRFAELRAAVGLADVPRASALLAAGVELPGLREGARDLERLWWGYASARLAADQGQEVDEGIRAAARTLAPLPWELDFRMEEDDDPDDTPTPESS